MRSHDEDQQNQVSKNPAPENKLLSDKPVENSPRQNLITLFTQHRVAANLLMILLLLAGVWGIKKINTQFFPSFELDIVIVNVIWSGAAAEDIERSIVLPIEEAIRSINGIDTLYSTSSQGRASIRLELVENTDVQYTLDEVKQKIDSIRSSLPSDAEAPIVQRIIRYDNIASMLITSDNAAISELRILARRFERELLDQGIRKIDFTGMPDEEIAIQIPAAQLHSLGLSLNDIATNISQRSVDLPAGTAAKSDGARQIRSLSQQRDVEGFKQLPLISDSAGRLVRLGDIADIDWRSKDNQVELSYRGKPAILLVLKRTESEDTLQSASIMEKWLSQAREQLPQGVELVTYDERWMQVQARIDLLLRNGLGGLVLIIAILFLFLNARVAFWVTVGIPVSFMATLAVLYMIGGSINMISLFGLIMALGIIVDDAIVVGEDTLTHIQMGESGLKASIGGAHRMLSPVIASSLTTIAAFIPLLIIGGTIGNILVDIPIVVICVILASLVECFLILPGHLHHSLRSQADLHSSKARLAIESRINYFRENIFRRIVRIAIKFRWATLASALGIFIIAIGLIMGGRVKFTFFPSVDREVFTANVQFTAGTDNTFVKNFLAHLDDTIQQTDREFSATLSKDSLSEGNLVEGSLIKVAFREYGIANFPRTSAAPTSGDEFGSLYVEMTPIDSRVITNREFIKAWRTHIIVPPGVEKFSIDQSASGPGGKPIEIKLSGTQVSTLKQASMEVQNLLKQYGGLSNIDDDLPFGKSQLIYELTPAGTASGLKLQQVGRQLRAAFDGLEVQNFYKGQDEVAVRVMLPDAERNRLSALEYLPIILPDGSTAPLSNIVTFAPQRGLDSLQRINGQLAINVTADLDESSANANDIIADLESGKLDNIISQYGIEASFEGKNKNQRETLADMKFGLILALSLIYIILAWVFASYSWPITVMLAIPLGLTGAILGHFITGLDLTILSLFGFFGLSGIVINDSIVLISFYKKLRAAGMAVEAAIEEAACQRLRAVLLTSLTTIAGLTPILFETSLQAQFLIPMATSIVFGLAYGTLLILLFIPAILTVLEHTKARLGLRVHHGELSTVA
ncbi:efflux RND transporter permease subunit [Neptunomonas antarctica]|uniref:Multidrug efflux pump subunit AcrB n=1 Tax=Neptunomonas antarctica TaxID=619304 RepID=A0A1N7PAD2_9GAMM|nr:efflux RND transporter permease subunit [Neptunomonas antarctica]SIT07572.1 Multidrug efflux pump subunit AcrB [Neptunomonas antarctica]